MSVLVLPHGLTNICALDTHLSARYSPEQLTFLLDKTRRGLNAYKFLRMLQRYESSEFAWLDKKNMKDGDASIIGEIELYGPEQVGRIAWGLNNVKGNKRLVTTHPSYYTSVLFMSAYYGLRPSLVIPCIDNKPLGEFYPSKISSDGISDLCASLNLYARREFFMPYTHPSWRLPGISFYELTLERVEIRHSVSKIARDMHICLQTGTLLESLGKKYSGCAMYMDCGYDYPGINRMKLLDGIIRRLRMIKSQGLTIVAKPIPGDYSSTIKDLISNGVEFDYVLPEYLPAELCIELLDPSAIVTTPSTALQSVNINSIQFFWIDISGTFPQVREALRDSYGKILPNEIMKLQTSY